MIKKLLTAVFLGIALFACGSGGGSSSSDKAVVTFNLGQEGKSLDPQLATSSSTIKIHSLLSEGLTKIDSKLQAVPGLASSWDISDDGTVWTFHLRDGIKWSNGDPITANDFKFAWLRALDPNTAAEYSYMLYPIVGAEAYNSGKGSADDVAIKVIDDKTLEVKLVGAVPYFDSLVGFITYFPTNEKFFNEFKDGFALDKDSLLSSGPFVIEEWEHGSGFTLVKNDNYYGKDSIKLDQINVKEIADPTAEINAYKNEELDIALVPTEQVENFKDDPALHVVPQATTWYLEFNVTKPALKNAKIRKAILLAIDKEEMNESIFKGLSKVAYTLTPGGVGMMGVKDDFVKELGDTIPKYNPEEAKKLLAEGLKEEGLTSLPELSIILNDSGKNKIQGEAMQEYIRNTLGVDVKIELMTFKERLARMQSKDFDIILAGWGADYKDPMTFLDLFVTNGGNNHTGYSNPKYDALIKASQFEPDKIKRIENLKEVERIIAEDMPIAPLFNVTRYFVVNPRVKGVILPAIGSELVLTEAYLEK